MSEKMSYDELVKNYDKLILEYHSQQQELDYYKSIQGIKHENDFSYEDLEVRSNMFSSGLMYACTMVIMLWLFILNLLDSYQPWFCITIPFLAIPLVFFLYFLLFMAGMGTSRKIWKGKTKLSTIICVAVIIVFALLLWLEPGILFEIITHKNY